MNQNTATGLTGGGLGFEGTSVTGVGGEFERFASAQGHGYLIGAGDGLLVPIKDEGGFGKLVGPRLNAPSFAVDRPRLRCGL